MKKSILIALILFSTVSFSQVYTGLSNLTGKVTCSVIDSSNGNIYIGGFLPTLGNLARSTDGGLTFQSIANVNDTVFDVKFYQNELWFVGAFDTVNGQRNKFVSRIKSNLVHPVKWDYKFIGTGIFDIEVYNNQLFVCGINLSMTGQPVGVYVYNTTDTIFQGIANSNHYYNSNKMTTDGSILYIYDSQATYRWVATWDGSTLTGIGGSYPAGYFPTDMKRYNNSMYLCGTTGIYRTDFSVANLIDTANTKCIVAANNQLYFGGNKFRKYDGVSFINIGTSNASINSIIPFGNLFYLIGSYNTINGQTLKNVSKYELFALPVANFTASDSIFCGNGTVNFTNTSTGSNVTYQWYFQGGSIPTSTTLNQTVDYSTVGNFRVILITTNPAGSDTMTKDNFIVVNAIPQQPTITKNGNILTSSSATGNQWIFSGSDMNNEVNQILTPTQNGDYQVRYTDNNGCSNTSANFNFVQDTIVNGFNEISAEKILIYPNPTTDFITTTSIKEFDIFNASGAIVGHYKNIADIRTYSNGIYTVKFTTGETAQIVKQ